MVGAVQLIASTLLSMKAYDEAKGACSAALAMTDLLFGPEALDVGASLVNLATAQMHTNTPITDTEALYARALKLYESALESVDVDDESKTECHKAIGGIYGSMGNLYFLCGNDEKAKEAYKKVEQSYVRGVYTAVDAAAPLKNLAILEWKHGRISFVCT